MAQRYVPASNDGRYARDRSPSRNPPGPYANPSNARSGDYPPRPDGSSFQQTSGFNRDVPRGPKALVDTPRTTAPLPPASRGRGFTGNSRSEYRSDFREQPGAWSTDRDKWNDRESDRRDRRPSPTRSRGSPTGFRDGRDPPPRDAEHSRERRDSREGPIVSNSYYGDARGGRGGFGRGGRGRGDWDSRPRGGRGGYLDVRGGDSFRPRTSRSRSPPPFRRWDRDDRDDREYDRTETRWPSDRRDDDRKPERDERERELDRYKKDKPFTGPDARRPSLTPTPHNLSARTTQLQASNRLGSDYDRDPYPPRKLSGGPAPVGLRDGRRDSRIEGPPARNDLSKEQHGSRTSSPPRAPEVPAFGSISYKPSPNETPWNVWRAPADQKPPAVAVAPSVPVPSAPVPTAPKADVEMIPPKAPKADRVAEQIGMRKDHKVTTFNEPRNYEATINRPQTPTGPATESSHRAYDVPTHRNTSLVKSPPSGPRQLAAVPPGPRHGPPPPLQRPGQAASPPTSPGFSAPSGPRALTGHTTTFAPSVPTGPKANRPSLQSSNRPPFGPGNQGIWQWNRFNNPAPSSFGMSVPAKRDYDGQEKLKDYPEGPFMKDGYGSPSLEEKTSSENIRTRVPRKDHEMPIDSPPAPTVQSYSPVANRSPARGRRPFPTDDEDMMDLDENDFEGNEAQYERERGRMESRMFDLSIPQLRGTVPLRNLAMLARISLLDIPFTADKVPSMRPASGLYTSGRDDLLVPKFEDEDVSMTDERSPPTRSPSPDSPSPIGTPELRCLPYLRSDTPLSLSEMDVLQERLDTHDLLKEPVAIELQKRNEKQALIDNDLRDEFIALYRPWRDYCEELDKERQAKAKQETTASEVPAFEPPPEISPSAQTPQEGRRRGGLDRFASEFDFEQVLKESARTYQHETEKREKEAELSKPNPAKEATIPMMLSPWEREGAYFHDTSLTRDPGDAVEIYELQPPIDDFTEEEHKALVQNFKEYPKKWGKLASGLPDRSYKDCINHYYATKWNKEYKPPKDKRRKQGGPRSNRMGRGMQSKPKANALISNLDGAQPDVYDGGEVDGPMIAMTERGRPKRAAAPIFGDKEIDEQSATSSATPARRGVSDNQLDKSLSKPRSSGTRGKGSGRSRGSRPLMRAESTSPEKRTPELNGRGLNISTEPDIFGARDMETANALTQLGQSRSLYGIGQTDDQGPLSTPQTYLSLQQQSQAQLQQPPPPTQQQQRTGNSSYWSVDEKNAFPRLLEHYGTDWQNIAQTMGTKTPTMVKNFYYRMMNSESEIKHEYDEKGRRGNAKRERGEALGPPPPSASSANPRRRPDPVPHVAPRPLAPSTEALEVDEESQSLPAHALQPSKQYPQTLGPLTTQSSQGYPAISQTLSPPRRPSSITSIPASTRPMDTNMFAPSISRSTHPTADALASLSREGYPPRPNIQMLSNPPSSQQLPAFSGHSRHDFGHDTSHISVSSYYNRHESQQRPGGDLYGQHRTSESYHQSPQLRYAYAGYGSQQTSAPESRTEPVSQFATSRPVEATHAQSSLQPFGNPFSRPTTTQGSSLSFLDSTRQHLMSPHREELRSIFNPPAPPRQPTPKQSVQPAPPPRTDMPKTSSIASLLNAEPDEPRHQRSISGQHQLSKNPTPPSSGYPYQPPPVSRPPSQPERRDPFLDRSAPPSSNYPSRPFEPPVKLPHWFKPNQGPHDYPYAPAIIPPQFRNSSSSYPGARDNASSPSLRRDSQTQNVAATSHNSGASVDWSSRANLFSSIPASQARPPLQNSPRERYERLPGAWDAGSSSLRGVGGSFEQDQRERRDNALAHERHSRQYDNPTTTGAPLPTYDRPSYHHSTDPFTYPRPKFESMSTLNRPSPPPRIPATSSLTQAPPSTTSGGTEMVMERRMTGLGSPPPSAPRRTHSQEHGQQYGQHQHNRVPNLQRSTSGDHSR